MTRQSKPVDRSVISSRRQFLKRAAAVGAGALAFPSIIPSSALGKDGAVAPSNRIVIGSIGTGGRGMFLLQRFLDQAGTQVVAACDVDIKHRANAVQMINQKYGSNDCKDYNDLRELVARKDIDVAVVATPDHWHALASIAAMNAGKDVYCEKPLANSVAEGRAIVDAAKKNNRVVQTGSMERSNPATRYAVDLVRSGKIGKVHTVRINLPCAEKHHQEIRQVTGIPPEMPVPEGFDYNTWLGHTPMAAYTEKRCHFFWRFNLTYGGGEMTDRGAHVIDIAQMCIDTDDTGPTTIEAKGVNHPDWLFTAFWDYQFTNTYANGIKMIGTAEGPRGLKLEGSDGWIFIAIHGGKMEGSNPEWAKAQPKDKTNPAIYHQRDFLDCVRSRRDPVAHAGAGHHTAATCHINNIAMRLGRKLKWDPATEQFDDAEANKWLKPQMRTPWVL